MTDIVETPEETVNHGFSTLVLEPHTELEPQPGEQQEAHDQRPHFLLYGMQFTDELIAFQIDRHTFHVHQEALQEKAPALLKAIEDADDQDVQLKTFSSDVFGLFVTWLYTNRLPDRPRCHTGLLPSKYRGPFVMSGRQAVDVEHFCSLYIGEKSESPYVVLSPEELRLCEYGGQHGSEYTSHLRAAYSFSAMGVSVEQCSTADAYMKRYGMDPTQHTHQSSLNEHFSLLILELVIFAQAWNITLLHNAAIETFRSNEQERNRRHPLKEHIHLVYEQSATNSRLRQLMADYAFTTCRRNNNRSALLDASICCPDFLRDLMKRDDAPWLVAVADPISCKDHKNAYDL